MTNRAEQTTKTQFELFKGECIRLIEKWGITGWRIDFVWDDEDSQERASVSQDLAGRVLCFYFPKKWADKETKISEEVVIESARHEVIHSLCARLRVLAAKRYVSEDEIYEANEEMARNIENAIKKGF